MADGGAFKARPTIYDGTQMRSRLEAGFAAWLDRRKVPWEYEPCAFGHPELGQYLPDFRLRNIPTSEWGEVTLYAEVKPANFLPEEGEGAELDMKYEADLEAVVRSAEILEFNEPQAKLAIFQPQGRNPSGLFRVAVVHRLARPHPDFLWPYSYYLALYRDRIGLASPVRLQMGPWDGEWWKGDT